MTRRFLVIDPDRIYGFTLCEALHATGRVESLSYVSIAESSQAADWRPLAALVATELLESSATTRLLRTSLPSLRNIVGMATKAHVSAESLQCDRVVRKPFDVAALARYIEAQLE